MIANQEQFDLALHQLASFKGMLEAMRLHLQETEPALIPLVSESYQHRIQELQTEICDYLLQQQARDTSLQTLKSSGWARWIPSAPSAPATFPECASPCARRPEQSP
ncbi:MAG TPA: hypothetical protein VFB38_05495 [Chthonomonadaceae bacterium]|nr:hypothetical protein [Chthonomonadaceae bacterium]